MDVSRLVNLNSDMPPSATSEGGVFVVNNVSGGKVLPEERQSSVRLDSQQEQTQTPPQDREALQGLVDQSNEVLSMRFSNLKFTVAEGTDIPVIRVEDSETGDLIRQIPSEQMVALAKALEEIKQGMLLEEQA